MNRKFSILITAICFFALLTLSFGGCAEKAELEMPSAFTVAAGELFNLAVDVSGDALYWGFDLSYESVGISSGYSGVGDKLVLEPEALVEDVKSVFSGDTSALILGQDGSLWMIGSPPVSEHCYADAPVKLMDGVISAGVSGTELLAVDSGGVLRRFSSSVREPEALMSGVTQVWAGNGYWLAVDGDGTLWGAGQNNLKGQIGNGTYSAVDEPVSLLDDVVLASAGSRLSAAVKADGSLWVWGEQGSNRPEKIADSVVYAEVSEHADGSGILYITVTGRLYVLGYDLLSGEICQQAKSIADGICAVSSCSSHILALKSDGSLVGWGSDELGALCAVQPAGDGMAAIPVDGIRLPDTQ